MTDKTDIEAFVREIRECPDADFYRTIWGKADTFSSLPCTTRDHFTQYPLSRRTYKKEQGIVRVVRGSGGPFLSAQSFSDIAREPYGIPEKRPLVFFADTHDAVEKSMWAYLNGMVPLAGEKHGAVTIAAARTYQIDSLITDPVSLLSLLPYLEERAEPLASISLVHHAFNPADLMQYRAFAKTIRLVLSLPETGAFATAALTDDLQFSLLEDCSIEQGKKTIVLTKYERLVTPIIRYDTGLLSSDLPLLGA